MAYDPTQANYGSSLTIEETTPPGPGRQARAIILVGAGLPFQGAEWSFENKEITQYYPGNPVEATQQNLGPRDLPSAWNGDWRRTRLSRTPCRYRNESGAEGQIIDPFGLVDAFEKIGRAGMRLRVTWSASVIEGVGSPSFGSLQIKNPVIIREGLVKRFAFQVIRHSDVTWTMEYDWASRGGIQDRVISTRTDEDLDAATNQLLADSTRLAFEIDSKIKSFQSTIRKSASRFTLGQLEQFALAPQNAVKTFSRQLQQNVSKLREVGELVNKFRSQPDVIKGTFINLASNSQSIANNLVDSLSRQPPEANVNKTRVASLLRGHRYFQKISETGSLSAASAYDLAKRLRPPALQRGNAPVISVAESQTTRAGQVIAVHIVKAGDTPQKISMKYYQDADHGIDVLRANKLPLHQPSFVPGTILIIPVLSNVKQL